MIAARVFVVLHALVALALGGASTHLALVTYGLYRHDPPPKAKLRLARIYSQTVGWLFIAVVILGSFAYPAYRYRVRGLYLDRHAPWAANLFDFKETLAALALPIAIALIVLGRRYEPADRDVRALFAFCAGAVFCTVAFNIVSGLVITLVRGV